MEISDDKRSKFSSNMYVRFTFHTGQVLHVNTHCNLYSALYNLWTIKLEAGLKGKLHTITCCEGPERE